MTDGKLYSSLAANTIKGELTDHLHACTGKINQFSKQKKIWFLYGFCLDLQKNPSLEKVPFFQSGFSCNSMLGFTLFQRWKIFSREV